MKVRKQCPECSEFFYGNKCSCGHEASTSAENLSQLEKKRQWEMHHQCCYKTRGNQCQMVGTVATNPGEMGEDPWGKKIQGPYYCGFHMKIMNRPPGNQNKLLKEYVQEQYNRRYANQFTTMTFERIELKVFGNY